MSLFRTLLAVAFAASPRAMAEGLQARVVCDSPQVTVQGVLPDAWSPEVNRACEALSTIADLDASAHATLAASSPHRVTVAVELTDGRRAERKVAVPARLVPTLEALLVVPRLMKKTELEPPAVPIEQPIEPTEPPRTPLRPVASAPMIAAQPSEPLHAEARAIHFEFGADVGARIGRDVAVGTQLFGSFHLAAWRLGAAVRWDPASPASTPQQFNGSPSGRATTQTFVGEIQFARHLTLWQLGIDVGVSPRLAVTSQARVDFRGGAFARIGYRLGAVTLFAALDTELSRPGANALGGPRSPVGFSGGLALGAAWVTP